MVPLQQGQVAQCRVADSPVGLGVASKQSPGTPLGTLQGRGAEHPPAGPGPRRKPGRDLCTVEGHIKGPSEGVQWRGGLEVLERFELDIGGAMGSMGKGGKSRGKGERRMRGWGQTGPGLPVVRWPPAPHRPGSSHPGSGPGWPPEPQPGRSGRAQLPSRLASPGKGHVTGSLKGAEEGSLLCPPHHDLPARVSRGALPSPQGAFPHSLGVQFGAGERSSAWERSWLHGGTLWGQWVNPRVRNRMLRIVGSTGRRGPGHAPRAWPAKITHRARRGHGLGCSGAWVWDPAQVS